VIVAIVSILCPHHYSTYVFPILIASRTLTVTSFRPAAIMVYLILSLLFSLPSVSLLVSADTFQDSCRSFQLLVEHGNSTTEFVEFVPQNTTVDLKYRDLTCGGPGKTAQVAQDICRVALNVRTSNQSGIEMEAWLPRNWNGRFLATGNGGIGGCQLPLPIYKAQIPNLQIGVDYSALAYTTQHGFAAVGANNGHNGTTGKAFYKNPQVVADFADRS
jgi:feruloyl esterase